MPESIDLYNLFVQLIGMIGAGIYFLSYQFKENQKVFRIQFFAFVFYATHLLLLGAVTGAIVSFASLFRSSFLSSDNEKLHSKWACLFICFILAVVCFLTWDGPISLLPAIANIAVSIAGYTHSEKNIRSTMIFVNAPLWITYDFLVGSWSGVIDEAATLIAVIISIVRLGWNNLDKKTQNE